MDSIPRSVSRCRVVYIYYHTFTHTVPLLVVLLPTALQVTPTLPLHLVDVLRIYLQFTAVGLFVLTLTVAGALFYPLPLLPRWVSTILRLLHCTHVRYTRTYHTHHTHMPTALRYLLHTAFAAHAHTPHTSLRAARAHAAHSLPHAFHQNLLVLRFYAHTRAARLGLYRTLVPHLLKFPNAWYLQHRHYIRFAVFAHAHAALHTTRVAAGSRTTAPLRTAALAFTTFCRAHNRFAACLFAPTSTTVRGCATLADILPSAAAIAVRTPFFSITRTYLHNISFSAFAASFCTTPCIPLPPHAGRWL